MTIAYGRPTQESAPFPRELAILIVNFFLTLLLSMIFPSGASAS